MSANSSSDLKFEIGHVLLIDIVGYSKFLINEQRELLQEFNEIVRQTAQVRGADATGLLLRLPTGDGMALIFRDSPETPVRCALEIGQALKSHPALKVRMGIHSGPVSEVEDVSERTNIAGYTNEAGNPEVPAKLQGLRGKIAAAPSGGAGFRRRVVVALAVTATITAAVVLWVYYLRPPVQKTAGVAPAASAAPAPAIDKSIAVLPFENLSDDKSNAAIPTSRNCWQARNSSEPVSR